MTFDSNRLESSVKNVSRCKICPLQAALADVFGQFLLLLHLLWSFRRHSGLKNEQKVGQSGYYLHVSRQYASSNAPTLCPAVGVGGRGSNQGEWLSCPTNASPTAGNQVAARSAKAATQRCIVRSAGEPAWLQPTTTVGQQQPNSSRAVRTAWMTLTR